VTSSLCVTSLEERKEKKITLVFHFVRYKRNWLTFFALIKYLREKNEKEKSETEEENTKKREKMETSNKIPPKTKFRSIVREVQITTSNDSSKQRFAFNRKKNDDFYLFFAREKSVRL